MARLGASVVLVCRDRGRGERAMADIAAAATGGQPTSCSPGNWPGAWRGPGSRPTASTRERWPPISARPATAG
ncbi:MAG TPA: hypothetical protein VMU94_03020 [Streptosporangiaceae bacterium]|nr:hypothetical protein [Streptosporangiaceae bacterium]